MKKTGLLIALLLLSLQAQADNSPFYMGLKIGFVDNSNGIDDAAVNTAFDLGYTHNRHLSTEFEISQTVIDGDNNGNDWTADSWSIFAALRTSGSVKLKGKIGLTNLDGSDNLSLATGIGISYWSMGGLAEIEYTRLDDNIDFISFGVNYFY